MPRRLIALSCLFALALCCTLARAAAPTSEAAAILPPPAKRTVSFVEDIEPIFATHCYHCHGPDEQEGRLRLDAKAIVMQGGQSDPAVVPGDSERSVLVRRLAGLDDHEQMPTDDDPLSAEAIGLVRAWIDQGALWPDGVGAQVAAVKKHWAYVAPQRPTLPEVRDAAWCGNEIDRFILGELEEAGLGPSPQADPAVLIRRVYLDLVGIPPSVEEVDAFLAAPSPEAYEAVVDRLLASPHYGERWAIPWLDAARYADSNGYQRDGHREVWAYRDWVVDALNADMPFDQFSIEQLAGDLLPNATESQKIATGFHRCVTVNVEAGVDQEENRTNQVIDRVNVTGTVWLGSTIECTQCHNHKFDPFTQRDYYRLLAYFNSTQIETDFASERATASLQFTGPSMELSMPEPMRERRKALEAKLGELEQQLAARSDQCGEAVVRWAEQTAQVSNVEPAWHTLEVGSFESSGQASHTVLEDESVLLAGELPGEDTYTITFDSQLAGVTALKVEALTDESLPSLGPGRGDDERPNFILSEFTATTAPLESPQSTMLVGFSGAEADFSQRGWDVSAAIDGDLKTGWGINPQFYKPHWAIFRLAEPMGFERGTRWVLKLEQRYGGSRTIGRVRVSALVGYETQEMPKAIARALATPAEERTARQQRILLAHYLEHVDPQGKAIRGQIAKTQKQLTAVKAPTSLVMVELPEPRESHIFQRGSFLSPGEEVEPGTPSILHALPGDAQPNRLGLARWLVDRANPLVGRVTVNRWWAQMMGRGIVTTPEDFGTQSDPPTHPALLDWLAVEFMEAGWSTKHIHKLIVMSSTYRQSSAMTPELLERDPYNALYARGPRFRLPAELIRDNALAVSGLLSDKLGGPPVFPPQPAGIWRVTGAVDNTYRTSTGEDRYRRGLYTVWRRSAPYPSMVNFDATDRGACVVKRPITNTPLQALTLLNDPVYVEAAGKLAERVLSELPGADARVQIEHAFRLCVARAPRPAETQVLLNIYRQELKRLASDPNSARAIVGNWTAPPELDAVELAAWFHVTNILLNLDETITKS